MPADAHDRPPKRPCDGPADDRCGADLDRLGVGDGPADADRVGDRESCSDDDRVGDRASRGDGDRVGDRESRSDDDRVADRHRPGAIAEALARAGHIFAWAAALVAPPACWGCRARVAVGAPLCPACRADLPFLRAARCPRCGLPAPCGARCPAAGSAVARAWAPVAFDGPARALVHALKFRAALGVADVMAAQIVAGAPADVLAHPAVLVPVPTHPRRRRARGFDHSERLAAAIGARTGLPVARCLVRGGPPTRQAGAPRSVRRVPGRIVVRPRGDPPRVAVLVDDVHTTGATLEACARALRRAGSSRVSAVAYARALR